MDSEKENYLATLEVEEMNTQGSAQDWGGIFRDVMQMAVLTDARNLDDCLDKVVEIVQSLLGPEIVSIYRAESNFLGLKKLKSSEPQPGTIPDDLNSNDLIKLSKPVIWMPGKRVVTSLHRYARSFQLSYLASTPLGKECARFGLLVVADQEKQPHKYLLNYLKILGEGISSAIAYHILIENLRDRVEKQRNLLAIRDSLVDNMQEGTVILDLNYQVKYINPAAELMLGYTIDEVLNQLVENILIGADLLLPALEAASNGIATHNIGNVSLHHRSGKSFPASVRTIPAQVDEEIVAIIVFVQDVSEHEQIRVRTRQLEHRAVLGEFSAAFAHEVRNPINNIHTGLELLGSRLNEGDPNHDIIQRTIGDCQRLNHLMESFLALSRPVDTTKFEVVDMLVLVKRTLDRWQPRFSHMNVKPIFLAAENLPKIWGDPKSLERVFINLISNAVDAMHENGGTLSVRVILNDTIINHPQLEVTVSDNGPGIPDEIKDRIFEPFVTTNPHGTGLGLAITKNILTDHRGSISVNSFPGGTVFHVFLPVHNGA